MNEQNPSPSPVAGPRAARSEGRSRAGSRLLETATFLYLWLTAGFAAGTATLLGPVRWSTTLCRTLGWGSAAEDGFVWAILLLFIVGSAAGASRLTRLAFGSARGRTRLGVPLVSTLAAAAAVLLWMNPGLLEGVMGEESRAGSRFTFGPYPTEERMARLKQEGYTAVISLLHPAVVPFEPKLIEDEKALAAQAGLELIHVPLLPWISENAEGLETIKQIAARGKGRYYVHCYLGRDRVHLVKRIVEQAGAAAEIEPGTPANSLAKVRALERGEIYALGREKYLTPFPTDEEFMTFILAGDVRQVVSLLDPNEPEQRSRIEQERELLARYAVPFEVIPLSGDPYDPVAVLDAVRRVKALPSPLVVHSFQALSSGREPALKAFLTAYRTGKVPRPHDESATQPLNAVAR